MHAITPAVDRYLKSCRKSNIQGVRAYLTTIHCNPHWAYRGLQYAVEGESVSALHLICEYKKKVNDDYDPEWMRLSTESVKRLLSKNVDTAPVLKMLELLLESNPKPDLNSVARSVGESKSLGVLEIALPYLSTEQKNSAFERACKTKNNADFVQRMLSEINLESVWAKMSESWDKPYPENALVVENFLLRDQILNEIEITEKAISRRKM